jgi:enoyl-CoA hydratase/carnithine racemase
MSDITGAVSTNAAGEPLVLVQCRGPVAIVTLNRPEVRNAVNEELTVAVADALDELESDDAVWVIVLTGAGDKAFCAGQDLKAISRPIPPAAAGASMRDLGGWAGITSRRFLKPVIAAVNGYALGGGTEICLAVDCVIADEHAQFGLPEVRRGIMAGAGGLQRLPRRIPPTLAMELILTGRAISAGRALELGLINQVVPSGGCVDAAVELAEEICQAAPLSVRYSKAVAKTTVSLGEDEAVHLASELRAAVTGSEDFTEGPRAFAEKRPPVWKGR